MSEKIEIKSLALDHWFEALKRRSRKGEVSKQMRINYESTLRQYLTFVNSRLDLDKVLTPDDIIAQATEDEPEVIIDQLNEFEKWLQGKEVEGYRPRELRSREKYLQSSVANHKAHGTIRGFYTHNRVWLPKGRRTDEEVSKTKKNDVNHAVFVVDEETSQIVQDYTQFRHFLSNLSFRDQTIALCILSSSQDPSDVLKLKISFVKNQNGKARLYWSGNREKTGILFRTFLSTEATKFLRQYIEQERHGADPDEPIFMSTGGKKKEPIPLVPRHVSQTFAIAANKMGLLDNGRAQNPFRPKRLRSIFSTACYQAKIDDGARHIFMGHSGSVSEKYREMPVPNLELIYAQVEVFVTVYAEDRSQELVQSIAKSEKALDLALDLREEVKQLREMNAQLAEHMGRLEAFVESLGYEYPKGDEGEVKYDEEKDERRA